MKQTQADQQLAQLLKQQAYQPGDNPWFTPRVLNKLPAPARRRSWMPVVLFAVAILACLAGLIALVRHQDFTVITVRDLLYFATALVATLVVTWQGIMALVKTAD